MLHVHFVVLQRVLDLILAGGEHKGTVDILCYSVGGNEVAVFGLDAVAQGGIGNAYTDDLAVCAQVGIIGQRMDLNRNTVVDDDDIIRCQRLQLDSEVDDGGLDGMPESTEAEPSQTDEPDDGGSNPDEDKRNKKK
jgi:hypothetical protein